MSRRDRVTSYVFIAIAIYGCVESWRLGLGKLQMPGPGFLPFGASAIIGVIAACRVMVAGRRQGVESSEPLFRRERLAKFAIVLAAMFGYSLMLYYVGFLVATAVFVGVCVRAMERKSWWRVAAASCGSALAVWVLFDYWLMIQIPRGIWVGILLDHLRGYAWK